MDKDKGASIYEKIFEVLEIFYHTTDIPIEFIPKNNEEQPIKFGNIQIQFPNALNTPLLTESVEKVDTIECIATEYYQHYIVATIQYKADIYGYIIAGPYLLFEITPSILNNLINKMNISIKHMTGLKNYYSQLNVINKSNNFYNTLLLKKLFDANSLIYENKEKIMRNSILREKFNRDLIKHREDEFIHHSYFFERFMFDNIFKSEEDNSLEIIRRAFEFKTPIFCEHDPIRSNKNLVICGIALLERYAIEYGLDAHLAFTLGDVAISTIEKAKTIPETEKVIMQLLIDLKNEIKKNSRNTYSLPVQKCLNYIQYHISETIRIHTVAKKLQMNVSYLSRLFKKELGISFSDYVTTKKISEAKKILDYTDYTSLQISTSLGFSSQSYFIKTFKKIEGITPEEYRKRKY